MQCRDVDDEIIGHDRLVAELELDGANLNYIHCFASFFRLRKSQLLIMVV